VACGGATFTGAGAGAAAATGADTGGAGAFATGGATAAGARGAAATGAGATGAAATGAATGAGATGVGVGVGTGVGVAVGSTGALSEGVAEGGSTGLLGAGRDAEARWAAIVSRHRTTVPKTVAPTLRAPMSDVIVTAIRRPLNRVFNSTAPLRLSPAGSCDRPGRLDPGCHFLTGGGFRSPHRRRAPSCRAAAPPRIRWHPRARDPFLRRRSETPEDRSAHSFTIHSLLANLALMTIRKPVVLNVVLAVVIVGALIGGYFFLFPVSSTSTAATQLTSTVQQGVVSNTITASGAVAPASEQVVSFPVSGTIATVNVGLGQTVAAGQLLGSLQTPTFQQAVNNDSALYSQARAQLSNANAALAATEATPAGPNTTAAQTISSINSAKQQVANAQNQVTTDSQALTKDETNLAETSLTAPIAGLVIAVNGAVGQTTGSGSAGSSSSGSSSSGSSGGTAASSSSASSSGFVTIADVSAMTVSASIAEADIASVTVGQKAVVTFPAVPGETANATVTSIAPTATTSNSVVTYATMITLASIPAGLRLGQTASVAITTKSSAADALYVPAAAITTANGVSTVKLVGAGGKLTPTTVTLGIVGTVGTEIKTGVKLGETVSLGVVAPTTTGTAGTGRGGFGGGFGGGAGFGGRGAGGAGSTTTRGGN
jgi:macrolide-specific efflux system membrane fusion protein